MVKSRDEGRRKKIVINNRLDVANIPSQLILFLHIHVYGRMLLCSLNIAIGGSFHASLNDATQKVDSRYV